MFKFRSLCVLLLLPVVLLSGCRLKEPPQAQQDFTGVVLNYYKFGDKERDLEDFVSAYEASHKGLKINLRTFDDFAEYEKLILNEMAEGAGPDLFSMPNTWFASNYRKLMPLPPKFGTPADYENIFVQTAYDDLVRVTPEGVQNIYGIPLSVDTLALYYNEAFFEDRLASRGKPAETWEQLAADVPLLNVEDNSFGRLEVGSIALGRADNVRYGVELLYLLFLQNGVSFYNENLSEAVFASAEGQKVFNFFLSFADDSQKNYAWNEFLADDEEYDELDAFVTGKVAMFAGFSEDYTKAMERIDLLKSSGKATISPASIRIAPIPQMGESFGREVGQRVAYANYLAETVSRNSQYAEVAWDFLLELTKKENLAAYFKSTKRPTSRRDMLDEQANDPIYGVFARQAGYAKSFPLMDKEKYRQLFSDLVVAAGAGSRSATLSRVQDEIERLLPKGGLVFEIQTKELEN